jgi:hypothetical protein
VQSASYDFLKFVGRHVGELQTETLAGADDHWSGIHLVPFYEIKWIDNRSFNDFAMLASEISRPCASAIFNCQGNGDAVRLLGWFRIWLERDIEIDIGPQLSFGGVFKVGQLTLTSSQSLLVDLHKVKVKKAMKAVATAVVASLFS